MNDRLEAIREAATNTRALAEDAAGDLRIDSKVAWHLSNFALAVLDAMDAELAPQPVGYERIGRQHVVAELRAAIERNMEARK
jgi:hypothetical protein